MSEAADLRAHAPVLTALVFVACSSTSCGPTSAAVHVAPTPDVTESRSPAHVARETCAPRSVEEALGCATLAADETTAWTTVFDAAIAASADGEEALNAGRHVVCEAQTLDAERAYQLARMLRTAGDVENATVLFALVMHASPTGPLAPEAAEQALDGLNRLAGEAGADADLCYARMDALVTQWLAEHACGSSDATADDCERWSALRCTIRFHGGLSSSETDPARSIEMFEQVHGLGCAEGDQALFNAAVVAERSGDNARALALREELRRAYPTSPVADRPPP